LIPRTVSIGGVDKPDLLAALRERDVRLNRAAEVLFADPRFTVSQERRTIEIAAVSVTELGFADGATYRQVTARALASGLEESPLELGPHLRLQFLAQPEGAAGEEKRGEAPPGSITIASVPLDDTDETPKGFYLRRSDGVLWLRGYWSWPGHVWKPNDVLVFARTPVPPLRHTGSVGRKKPVGS
jgi:hypothetical protein